MRMESPNYVAKPLKSLYQVQVSKTFFYSEQTSEYHSIPCNFSGKNGSDFLAISSTPVYLSSDPISKKYINLAKIVRTTLNMFQHCQQLVHHKIP